MNKYFYTGPKIEIGKDSIKIKERNIRLSYQDIKSIRIKYTRLDRAGLLYIIAGIIALSLILFLFFIFIHGLFSDTTILRTSGLFYKRRMIILLLFFFTGGPFFIIFKVRKYLKKYLMLVISWDHHDFRIKISELGRDVNDLKTFFEGKVRSIRTDIPDKNNRKD